MNKDLFSGFSVFLLVMRHIITLTVLFFMHPTIEVVPDLGPVPVCFELDIFSFGLTDFLFHTCFAVKIIPVL
jgi:hypothetical protein